MFRLEDLDSRWTFFVERTTLEALAGDTDLDLEALFDNYRKAIYEAAFDRMKRSQPSDQHRLGFEDIGGFRDTIVF